MKKQVMLLMATIMTTALVLSGCGKAEPFSKNPENSINIKSIDNVIKNEADVSKLYQLEFEHVTTHKISDNLQKELDAMKKKDSKDYDSNYKELNANTLKLYVLYDINDLQKTYTFDKLASAVVQDYLDISKLNKTQGKGLNLWLSSEMENEKPVGKVQDYMKKNDIIITDIVFPQTYESKNTMVYPVRYTFSYMVKGTIKGQSFEKQITQDYYFGLDIKDLNNWKKGFKMPIMAIKDHNTK